MDHTKICIVGVLNHSDLFFDRDVSIFVVDTQIVDTFYDCVHVTFMAFNIPEFSEHEIFVESDLHSLS